MTNLVTTTGNLPADNRPTRTISYLDDLLAKVATILGLGIGPSLSEAEEILRHADDAVSDMVALKQDVEDGTKKATRREIGEAVAMLGVAFPTSRAQDSETFSRMLAEDIASAKPSSHGLRAVTLTIRRTSKFMPSIAEVMTKLEEEATRERGAVLALQRLPEHAKSLRELIGQRRPLKVV